MSVKVQDYFMIDQQQNTNNIKRCTPCIIQVDCNDVHIIHKDVPIVDVIVCNQVGEIKGIEI